MKKYIIALLMCMCMPAYATTVVATVNGKPITDDDITARTKLMSYQGKTSTDNRRVALQNIIDDNVKLNYASNFGVNPTDQDADAELKKMGLPALSENAISGPAALETADEAILLPEDGSAGFEMTMVRLVDIPDNVAAKLTKPKNCDDAMRMAENLGGAPQKITARQYELSSDVRDVVAELPILTWSRPVSNSVFLVCNTKKTSEYGKLDKMLKQNAEYKQAMFMAEQQLKQLRRRAAVIIKDDRYKL